MTSPRSQLQILILLLLLSSGLLLLVIGANPLWLVLITQSASPSKVPPDVEISSVSGFYGPGTYWAWVICTLSAVVGSTIDTHSSSVLSTDQIVSYIYSTFSVYWCYLRIVRYGLFGPNIFQDLSVQAASLVLNVSSLFHGLGAVLGISEKKKPWVLFACWDLWLLTFSPAMTANTFSIWLHSSISIVGLVIAFIEPNYRRSWKVVILLLATFVLLEGTKAHHPGTYPFSFTPKTTSNLTDMDQMVSLVTAIAVVIYQWQLWNVPGVVQRFREHFQRKLPPQDSNLLDALPQ